MLSNIVYAHTPTEEIDLYPYHINDLFGYVDNTNTIIIPAIYTLAKPFQGDVAIVKYENKEGIIDSKGKWVIKPRYNHVEIKDIGGTQIFIVSTGNNAWYKMYRWRLMPNLSLFSGYRPPFIATTVPYSKWEVYDRKGNKICSESRSVRHDDYNDRADYNLIMCPFEIISHNDMIYVYRSTKKIKTYKIKDNKLVYHNTLKNVQGLTKNGYLSGDDESANYLNFKNQSINSKPFIYKRTISSSNTSSFEDKIWENDGKYLCILYQDRDFISIPENVLNQGTSLVCPLKGDGSTFWIVSNNDAGILDREGKWIYRNNNAHAKTLVDNGMVTFYEKNPTQYFIYSEKKIYEFPVRTEPITKIVNGIWIVRHDENNKWKYGVYDIEKQQWCMPLTDNYISKLSSDHYYKEEKVYKENDSYKSYLLKYSIIDINGKEITTGNYRSMWATSNKNLVIVIDRNTSKEFYVKVDTGEELISK